MNCGTTQSTTAASPLWAITCYFNPVGYKSRQANFHAFREHLPIPLLAVELSFDKCFHLRPADADLLIQVGEGDVLWQKERLLNIALQHLPDHCQYVMWLDCELVFERQDLADASIEALQEHVLIQPFSHVYDLKPGVPANSPLQGNTLLERESMAWQIAQGSMNYGRSKTDMKGHYSPGHAWAVRRSAIEALGFYDAMILGSADFTMAKAAINHAEDVVSTFSMNPYQADHFLAWAKGWKDVVDQRMGVVKGGVRHLWHGDLDDRGYATRYASLAQFDFNPYEDIRIADSGCWKWNSHKPEMHQFFRDYFKSRKEDGQAVQ